jgi:hypothetical protein
VLARYACAIRDNDSPLITLLAGVGDLEKRQRLGEIGVICSTYLQN